MKILKLKLYQESVCYKKPFAFKVAETYPLPPYSTVIGMFHKILQAKSGEYFPLNISVQGDFESIYNNYQNLRMYKGKEQVTAMPRNVHQLLGVNLIIHVEAEDNIIDKIYDSIANGKETFVLGRNEDIVRVDEFKIIKSSIMAFEETLKYNAYVPIKDESDETLKGIRYRLNATYTIDDNDLRKWNKVNVVYLDKGSGLYEALKDEDDDLIFFYN